MSVTIICRESGLKDYHYDIKRIEILPQEYVLHYYDRDSERFDKKEFKLA